MEESKNTPSEEKKHLHILIEQDLYRDLKNLSLEYGSIAKVIEESIKYLKIYSKQNPQKPDQNIEPTVLWNMMRRDINMLAVGRKTFLSYIEKIPKTPQKENNAIELIEWINGNRSINSLNLIQILQAIRVLWLAGNYFREILIEPLDFPNLDGATQFKMVFYHDFNERNYGQYWADYFTTILESPPLKFKVKLSEIRNNVFYLSITT